MAKEVYKNRLAEINQELIRMQFITVDAETGENSTNCMMTMTPGRLPSGTMDADVYKEMIDSRKEKIANLTKTLKECRAKSTDRCEKKREEETISSRLHEERMALYNILVDVTPINTAGFRMKLESLIGDKIEILECLRILQMQGEDIGEIF